jgi:DNA mismatch repair ATPase MutS
VEEILKGGGAFADLHALMARMPDLERSLLRAHYGRCAPLELVAILKTFAK